MDERRSPEARPSPDALLEQAAGSRGRLKVFLGAAPGVGKTYQMLRTAQAKRLDGVDLVVGVVETHGRAETEALLQGLEIMPRRRADYKGHTLDEMDIDGILARRPKLVLVDELAHTNVPGSRHPKRYLDVEELLDAGIDVYTTLNIQHVESLNDVVARITRIRVRETVPDGVIDRADEVEVVDLTPGDLIQRLRDGKVYVPRQAERAIRHYFLPGNLTALRELALRRTAQRVDAQMVSYMRAHAIDGPWPAGERLLVCIGEERGATALVRYARRLAERLQAPWTAIHVETSRTHRRSEAELDRISEGLRLALELGGQTATIPAQDAISGILDYARENNVTHIVIAKSPRSRLSVLFRGSLTYRLIQRAGPISVHVIAEDDQPEEATRNWAAKLDSIRKPVLAIGDFFGSAAVVAVALATALILRQYLAVANIALVFLVGVLGCGIAYGLFPALFACFASVLAYNFFFLPPLYTFTIADPENVVALFFFAIVAVIASNLTARVRDQALTARQRARTTEELYQFSRKLAGAVTLDDLLWAVAFQIASMLRIRVVVLLPDGETIAVRAGYPPEDVLPEADLAAAKWSWDHGNPAGRGAETLPGAKWLFLPMRTGRGPVAVVGLESDRPGPLLTPDQRRLLDALADQAALAIERTSLALDLDQARLAAETERLRSALLTSISHDLRTPLAAILGSATSLRAYRDTLDDKAQQELLGTIQDEAERLNRFIANLLDMTRLESGAIAPRTELVDLGDVVGSALERARNVASEHRIVVQLAPQLPLLKLDPVLLEQVLFNLIDNAAKYAPAGSTITVQALRDSKIAKIEVLDEGEGIPGDDLERIFDKFYRVHATDRRRAGTGLGLAICRGFVSAMGGTIVAGNRPDRTGAAFRIEFPVGADASLLQETAA